MVAQSAPRVKQINLVKILWEKCISSGRFPCLKILSYMALLLETFQYIYQMQEP